MPAQALLLVLLAAGFHAAWNLTLHDASDRLAAIIVSGFVAGIILLPGVIFFPPWSVWPLIALSALAEAAYSLFLTRAYERGSLGLTYPLARGTAPLLVTLGAWVVLAQAPSAFTLAGAATLAVGLAIIALAARRSGQLVAVGFALLTGGAIATYALIDARAVQRVSPLGYLGPVLALTSLLLLIPLRGRVARLRPALGPGVRIAFGSVAAYLLVLWAFQLAPAGPVATLREVSVLIGLLLSSDRKSWRLWIGAGLVVFGAILTAL
jgi:drug/metabolite transporter (DMT)-like permease